MLDSDKLFWKTWKLGVHMGLLAHKNMIKGWEGTQLLKAYDEVRTPPSVAPGIQHLRAPTPSP